MFTKTRKLALPAFAALALLAGFGPGRLSLMQPAWAEDSGGGGDNGGGGGSGGGDHGSGDHGKGDKGSDRGGSDRGGDPGGSGSSADKGGDS